MVLEMVITESDELWACITIKKFQILALICSPVNFLKSIIVGVLNKKSSQFQIIRVFKIFCIWKYPDWYPFQVFVFDSAFRPLFSFSVTTHAGLAPITCVCVGLNDDILVGTCSALLLYDGGGLFLSVSFILIKINSFHLFYCSVHFYGFNSFFFFPLFKLHLMKRMRIFMLGYFTLFFK